MAYLGQLKVPLSGLAQRKTGQPTGRDSFVSTLKHHYPPPSDTQSSAHRFGRDPGDRRSATGRSKAVFLLLACCTQEQNGVEAPVLGLCSCRWRGVLRFPCALSAQDDTLNTFRVERAATRCPAPRRKGLGNPKRKSLDQIRNWEVNLRDRRTD
jgi:hypothetical protein